nr:S4 domain-containing protein [Rubrivivax sp.]
MNASDADPPLADVAATPEAPTPKAPRKRAARRVADAAAVAPVDTEGAAGPAAPEAAAPRPRRARAKRAADDAVTASVEPAERAAETQVPTQNVAASPDPGVRVERVSTAEAPPDDGAERVPAPRFGQDDAAAGEVAGPRSARRRGRNRRRGRRGDPPTSVTAADEGADPAAGDDAADAGTGSGETAVVVQVDPSELFAGVVSGRFDDEAAPDANAPLPAPPKRVLPPDADAPKLHKVLAQAGIGSRRDMEQMILEGRITVNGQPAHIGQRISFGDRISIGGKPVKVRIAPPPARVLAYHK